MTVKVIRTHNDDDVGGPVIACDCELYDDAGTKLGKFRPTVRASIVPDTVPQSGLKAWLASYLEQKVKDDPSTTGQLTGKFNKALDLENQIVETQAALDALTAKGAAQKAAIEADIVAASAAHTEVAANLDAAVQAHAQVTADHAAKVAAIAVLDTQIAAKQAALDTSPSA